MLVAILLGGFGYWFVSRGADVYRAEAKVFIGNALQPNPALQEVDLGLRIAPTYAQFAKNYDVMEATIETLNLDITPERLRKKIDTRIVIDTAILVILVSDSSPERAADIANEVARNLIRISPSNLTDDEVAQMDIQNNQIIELQAQMAITQEQSLEVLEAINDASEAGDQEEVDDLTDQYNGFVDRLNASRATLAQLSDTFVGLSNRANRLVLFEEARPPSSPIGTNPLYVGIIGFLAGGGFAVSGLFLYLEFIDNKLRTEYEVRHFLDLPALGIVKNSRTVSRNHAQYLTSGEIARSHIAEGYRTIQTNLLFSTDDRKADNLFLIASPRANAGRTFTASNLAVIAADSGLRVLLIDADLRNPMLHSLFDVDNTHGMATLLQYANSGDLNPKKINLEDFVQETSIAGLDLISSGTDAVELSSRILAFDNAYRIIEMIKEAVEYDMIFFDSPPGLQVADAYNLAGMLKPYVIFVISKGTTLQDDALKSRDQFRAIGGKIKGVVINRG
jgi:capsular exopolysaccharide synthesis family protein